MTTQGQGHSLVQSHSDSTFSNFFSSETACPVEAKFHMDFHGMRGMKICSNVPGHMTMPIYGKSLQKTESDLFPNASAWVQAYTALIAHVFPFFF